MTLEARLEAESENRISGPKRYRSLGDKTRCTARFLSYNAVRVKFTANLSRNERLLPSLWGRTDTRKPHWKGTAKRAKANLATPSPTHVHNPTE